jgi:hypothetical protein
VKWMVLALALAVLPAVAQEKEKKKAPPRQKPPAAAKAHGKATPEQIRKFNELQKKQGK